MTRKTWVLVIASILVSSTLLEVHVFAAGERKKIVMVSNSAAFVLLQEVLQNPLNGINVVHTLPMIYALAIELSPNQTDAELLNLLLGISGAQVYDDLRVSVLPITKSPDGVVFLTQDMYAWGLMRIGADVAHQKMPDWTGKGVQVAIVDTGVGDTAIVGCTHPDLPLIVVGFNALPGGGSYCDRHGHGTHMAGIIAARANKRGLIGVAPEAGIVAVKVLDDNGKGFLSNVLYGLQWIYDNQSQKQLWLVNMSLGFSADSPALLQATQHLSDSGTLIVASTGNRCSDDPGQDEGAGADGEGPTCDTPQTTDIKYPANYPWVLAVAATDDAK